jgi:hypothetical protein
MERRQSNPTPRKSPAFKLLQQGRSGKKVCIKFQRSARGQPSLGQPYRPQSRAGVSRPNSQQKRQTKTLPTRIGSSGTAVQRLSLQGNFRVTRFELRNGSQLHPPHLRKTACALPQPGGGKILRTKAIRFAQSIGS